MSEVESKEVKSHIEELGWHVVVVPGSERMPATVYSVGLFKNFGHPEIQIFGSDPAVLRRVIDRLGEQVRQGRRFLDGESVSGIVEHYDVRLDEVPQRFYSDDERFRDARSFYGHAEFPLMQAYWPDFRVCCP